MKTRSGEERTTIGRSSMNISFILMPMSTSSWFVSARGTASNRASSSGLAYPMALVFLLWNVVHGVYRAAPPPTRTES